MFSLDGRVALVTGSSRGLGFAMAKALAENGALVVINGRDRAAVEAGNEALKAAGLKAAAATFDLADSRATSEAISGIAVEYGRLDIVINNAGIQHRVPLTEWEDAAPRILRRSAGTGALRRPDGATRMLQPCGRRCGHTIQKPAPCAWPGLSPARVWKTDTRSRREQLESGGPALGQGADALRRSDSGEGLTKLREAAETHLFDQTAESDRTRW